MKYAALALLSWFLVLTAAQAESPARIPVIFDTDIGDDIDDTWALCLLLKSPQLDLKLVTTTYGKAEYRAKIIARLLTVAKRTDIPVGLAPVDVMGSAASKLGSRIFNSRIMRARSTRTVWLR